MLFFFHRQKQNHIFNNTRRSQKAYIPTFNTKFLLQNNRSCYFNARDFIIEKQIAQHFVQNTKCLSNSPFYACQIINPFLNLIISANHAKGEELR